jgi:hypothetical protein
MSVVVRGHAISLGRIGIGVLVGVALGLTHLSVHSQAAYKEGIKQGLRVEISRLQRSNLEREREVDAAARLALQRFDWAGAVRVPVEMVTRYSPPPATAEGAPVHVVNGQAARGGAAEAEAGWYWQLEDRVRELLSVEGGSRRG